MGIRVIFYLCFLCYLFQHIYYPSFDNFFGLAYLGNDRFRLFQLVTYGFLHVDFFHLIVNLFIIFIFGDKISQVFGFKNFMSLFLVCLIGGSLFQTLNNLILIKSLTGSFFPINNVGDPLSRFIFRIDYGIDAMSTYYSNTIGASAAAFGLMVAFTILFPRDRLYFFLLPFSFSARLFAIIYVGIEIYNLFYSVDSNIAHSAHLGGALFGLLVALVWRKQLSIY